MKIEENKSLKNYNTFGIDVLAKRFVNISQTTELKEILKNEKDLFILGGGSNMLLTKDIDKLVVHVNLKGKSIENEDNDHAYISAMAGENWHEFVMYCISKNYGGIENLSLIPGNIGTSPIQNIGAYGVELKDVFHSLEALEINTGKLHSFSAEDCKFGYRDSIFKNELQQQFIIVKVTFKLTKHSHRFNISYGAIKEHLNTNNPTIQDISNAVVKIRSNKLPDPKLIGNSGSFFKNAIVSKTHFEALKEKYPEIPNYPISETLVKIPSGWLIDQLGFKGKRFGACGVYEKQALVLVNYGGASGKDLLDLSLKIKSEVKNHFKIDLETEVNVI
jgi:UDP-N-acetylmuramate dehydrogenase